MKVLIAGGSGFMGRHLIRSLNADGHQVWLLTRSSAKKVFGAQAVQWDGHTVAAWGQLIDEMDAVVNLSGLSLYHWPWTRKQKKRFLISRTDPGHALATAIENASRRPGVFVQISGINHYGLSGDVADESTPPAHDYLAQLTVAWEEATKPVEDLGVRRVICRTSVVLARDAVLAWLLALPVRLFIGGPLGNGRQAIPWIHLADQIGAIKFLMGNENALGPYNLIAPHSVTNAEFMRTQAKVLKRPFWFKIPGLLLKLALGEMAQLVLEGRPATPKRLLELGYRFHFPKLEDALIDLYQR